MAECFWQAKSAKSDDAPATNVPARDVQALAGLLAIDAAAAWRVDQLGPLTTAYWNAHTKADLIDHAKRAGMKIGGEPKKGQIVAFLAAAKVPPPAGLGGGKKRAPKPR